MSNNERWPLHPVEPLGQAGQPAAIEDNAKRIARHKQSVNIDISLPCQGRYKTSQNHWWNIIVTGKCKCYEQKS